MCCSCVVIRGRKFYSCGIAEVLWLRYQGPGDSDPGPYSCLRVHCRRRVIGLKDKRGRGRNLEGFCYESFVFCGRSSHSCCGVSSGAVGLQGCSESGVSGTAHTVRLAAVWHRPGKPKYTHLLAGNPRYAWQLKLQAVELFQQGYRPKEIQELMDLTT